MPLYQSARGTWHLREQLHADPADGCSGKGAASLDQTGFIVGSDEARVKARVDERIRKEGQVYYGIAYADPPASRTRISGSRSKQLGRGAVK